MVNPETRCIECGGAVHSLNEDESGDPCVACAERLLETLPGVFHSPWVTARDMERSVLAPEQAVEGEAEAELIESSEEVEEPDWWDSRDDIVLGPDQPA